GELSGGNQQKVVLAKMLRTRPQVLLLDEPTRGIDINAKNEIYKLIDRLAAEGCAVVVISSEMPEIMALSDRIITISAGRLTAHYTRSEFSEEKLLKSSLPTT
ncbi:MAG: sugar ABC transporter ATP-binding protein, partial [Alistipes sp.]|nr:sugar ABC transporter ATP-binding protein [Alistipes sp.]